MFSKTQTLAKGDTAEGRTRTPIIYKMKETLCDNSNSYQLLTFARKSSILDAAGVLDLLMVKARRVEQNNFS